MKNDPTPAKLDAFEDPAHPGNSSRHHTGKRCVESGCDRPAGTHWSPLWCFEHNVERIKRIDRQLEEITKLWKK